MRVLAIVLGSIALLFFFWVIPFTGLASLLSYKEIKKTMPWLGRLIDSNEKIRAIVQNSLPSMVMIILNAFLPIPCNDSIPPDIASMSWGTTDISSSPYLNFLDTALRLVSGGSARADEAPHLRDAWPDIQASAQRALNDLH